MNNNTIGNIKIICGKIQKKEKISNNDLIKYLYIPIEIINNDGFESIFQEIVNILDFNNDGTYDMHDIEYLLYEINKQNLGIFLSLIKLISKLLKLTTVMNNSIRITNSNIIHLIFKIIIYALLIPLTGNNTFNIWSTQSLSDNNKTNLDNLFHFFETLQIIILTSNDIQSFINSINYKNYFSYMGCSCIGKYKQIDSIQIDINNNMGKIDSNIKKHMINKKLKNELIVIKDNNDKLLSFVNKD